MKIAHIGLGGMGKTVQKIAVERGHISVSEIDKNDEINVKTLADCDLAIECTLPAVAFDNIKKIIEAKKDCLVVTTAWYKNLGEVKKLVEKNETRLLYSPNFSIGVAIYERIIDYGSKLINKVDNYDIWAHEIHHKNKVDAPSGTAKNLEKILLHNIDRKNSIVEEALLHRKPNDDEIHFSSTRGGYNNFSHTVAFDSEAEVVELKHFSRNRDGYALGAVQAAEWLKKKPAGMYSMDDFLDDIL
jgi:4-hydroxy-tetrahydrodipicolinate reductase